MMAQICYSRIPNEMSWSSLNSRLPFVSSKRQGRILKQKCLQRAWQLWISERLVQNQMEKKFGQSCTFTQEQYGKPRIKDQDVHFNCSHSGDWVVCVFADEEIGIDIEQMKPIQTDLYTACFPECNHLNEQIFFPLWTVKEAYVKATGCGLYKELSTILIQEAQLESDCMTPIDLQKKHSFSCRRINLIKGYALAICGTKKDLESIEIIKETIESLTPH